MRLDIKIAQYGIRILEKYLKFQHCKRENRKKDAWNSLFKGEAKVKFKLADGLFIYHFKDSILSRLIYEGFEESEILFLRKYLRKSDIFLDIGANIGLYSLHAAQVIGSTGRVYAFEPAPITFSRLILNVETNNFNEIVKCVNIGLSDNIGMLKMNISNCGYDAWNTFAEPGKYLFDSQTDLQVETLDKFLDEHNIRVEDISLMKIDVEGWETYVIKGAINSLTGKNSPALIVEFTEEFAFAAGSNCYELYDLIKSYGYSWYTYDSYNNQLVPEPKRLHYPYNNLIAIKNFDTAKYRLAGII